jgi:TRAP-type transport system periplasmic protein
MTMPKNTNTGGAFKIAAATGILALMALPAHAQWRYAIEEALDEVQGVYAQQFKDYIEENSDHTVDIFPFGTLGEGDDLTELAQMGAIQFVTSSPGFMGSVIPELNVFLVPYTLPEEPEVLAEFFRSSPTIYEDLAALYQAQNLELLQMYSEGEVVMTTKEPVETMEDLQGVNFRVMTPPLLVETYSAFGATPTPLPWGEVYGALQLGMIQGQENPMFFVESTGMWEVTDHITFAGHNSYTTAVLANQAFFQGLPEEDQQLVRDAVDHAYDYIVEYQQGLQDRALESILERKPDMTVTVLDDAQREPFREAAERVRQSFAEMTGDSGRAILEGFEQDVEAARQEVEN